MDELKFVTDIIALENGKHLLTLNIPLSSGLNNAISQPVQAYFVHIVLLDLTIQLTQPYETEIWRGLGLHPFHPNYIFRVLGRRCVSERYMQHHNDGLDHEEVFSHLEIQRWGSQLVRPLYEKHPSILLPSIDLKERSAVSSEMALREALITANADQIAGMITGDEGEDSLTRNHFFFSPDIPPGLGEDQEKNFIFANQPSPLKAIDDYDHQNETQPVSLLNLPDLVHFRQESPEIIEEIPEKQFEFEKCIFAIPEREQIGQKFHYPHLEGLDEAKHLGPLGALERLKEWCEEKDDRIGIADLAPHLPPNEIVHWRQRLASSRLALYTPFLNVPAAHNRQLFTTVASGGAVCGIIAVRERVAGVFAAPANETIAEAFSSHEPQWQSDPRFLFQQRINAIWETEDGFAVLGARTLSSDEAWAHISVRRLIDYLKRQLVIDTHWAVFEPNDRVLWNALVDTVEARLRPLYDAGAFAGSEPAQAYFIRCDAQINTQYVVDNGQVIVLVGVAPALPSEFIVFQLVHQIESATTVTTNA
jgi:hypothetical protein